MYKLAVDFKMFGKGTPICVKDTGVFIEHGGDINQIGLKSDLQTLITHGIIEEVPEKQDAELEAFLKQRLDEGTAEISGAVRKLPFIGFDTDGNMRVIGFVPHILFSNKKEPKGEIQHTWTDKDMMEFWGLCNRTYTTSLIRAQYNFESFKKTKRNQVMNFNKLAQEINQINEEKGWNSLERSPLEIIALIHSEISEATEAALNKEGDFWIRGDGKPEGEDTEICDAIIRTLGYLAFKGQKIPPFDIALGHSYKRKFKHHAALHLSLSCAAEEFRLNGETIQFYILLAKFVIDCVEHLVNVGGDAHFEKVIRAKIDYNKTRPYLHGKRC